MEIGAWTAGPCAIFHPPFFIALTIALTSLLTFGGCERKRGTSVVLSTRTIAEFKPLTQLLHNQVTHVTCDTLGNVFYTTETERGQDVLFVITDTGIPRATQLTSANILAAMGETVGGSGSIQDVVAGPDGGIWFYFLGAKGSQIRAAAGVYYRRSESIHIALNQVELARLSGMGDSIGIARGHLIPLTKRMNLLLRHSDAWAMLAYDMARPGPNVDLKPARALKHIIADNDQVNLSKSNFRLAGGANSKFILIDHSTGAVWQVDPGTGQSTALTYLTGLPRDVSDPIVVKKDHLLFFISESEPLESGLAITMQRRLPQTTYPALMEVSGNDFTAIGRQDFRVPSGFPVYSLQIHQLIAAPDGSYVGYDLASGQLMRIRLSQQQ